MAGDMQPEVSNTPSSTLGRARAALALAAACAAAAAAPAAAQKDVAKALPGDNQVHGWHRVRGPERYGPDNLWEYLDGGAPLYLSYGMQECVTAQYKRGDVTIAADIQTFPESELAFGIYSAERSPEYRYDRSKEGHSYLAPGMSAFWKGPCYVKLKANSLSEDVWPDFRRLARFISGRLKGKAALPPAFDLFPPEKRVEYGEVILAANAFGHAFLNHAYAVDYRVGDPPMRLFLVVFADKAEAIRAYHELEVFFDANGGRPERVPDVATEAFAGTEPFYGLSVICYFREALLGALRTPTVAVGQVSIQRLLNEWLAAGRPGTA